MPPTPGATFVVWMIVLVAAVFILMLLFKVAVWWGENMSSNEGAEPVRADFRTSSHALFSGSDEPVRAHQNQIEPLFQTVHEPEREPSTLRNLTRAEEIALLAVQRNDDGSYRHSANKICELMGGTAAEVKAQVATIRGPAKPKAPVGTPLKRPANGW
jgi:hypothetical protein